MNTFIFTAEFELHANATMDNIQRTNIARQYELKEIESLQLAVSSVFDIVYALLADFLKVYISQTQA